MPLQLYVSNSLERLSDKLTEDLREQQGDVFIRPHLITQTEGINSWLKIQIAQRLGIASNLAFLSPTDIISTVYAVVCQKKMPPAGAQQLQWMVYQLLGDTAFMQAFPAVSGYYVNQEAKKLSLAMKVADLFDQYQVYRPLHIADWNKGILSTEPDLHWQSYLWQQLRQIYGSNFTDRTTIAHQILEALKDPLHQERLKKELPRIYFFGLAIITPYYLHLFKQLSEIVSVSFYLNNPAPETYWMDQVTEKAMVKILQRNKKGTPEHFTLGNDLLLNWGKVIKDSFWLLFNDESFLNVYDDAYSEPPATPQNLLQKIQTDIYNNALKSERQPLCLEDVTDGSITINAAYTPAREVEVLYNYLVQLVDQRKEQLAPRDILVMVNDIDLYAPFIRAVFDNAPYSFPYNIADESISQGNTLFSAIHQLLDISDDRFTSEKIMELLDNHYIRSRFGITRTELIRKALMQANIRFGWQGDAANDTRYFSWEYGLHKLLLGICISGSPAIIYNGEELAPVDAFEGDDAEEIVRLIHFIKTLRKYSAAHDEIKPLGEWMSYLKEMTEALVFESGEKEDDDYHLFIQYAERLEGDTQVANIRVSFEAFRKGFVDRLSSEKRKHSFIRGGITFCSFIPMRSVPFKVVAMLGLDYDKFPRKENQISFSLFNASQEKGDRNVKENDKHLFLETVLSARAYLYLSYKGRDIKDGSVLPPSLMVEELIDYVTKGVQDHPFQVRQQWITEHPLHGFSQRYFEGKRLYSYLSSDHLQPPTDVFTAVANNKQPVFKELELEQLIRFFEHPIRWYFNKVLDVYYKRSEDLLLPEEELFELSKWQLLDIQKKLIGFDDGQIQSFAMDMIRKGKLPLKNMGTLTALDALEKIRPLREVLEMVTHGAPEQTIPVALELDGVQLTGTISSIYEQQLVVISMPEEKTHMTWIGGYLKYLALRAMDLPLSLTLIYHKEKYNTYTLSAAQYDPQQALEKLTQCIQMFKQGHESPLLFYPNVDDYVKWFLSGPETYLSELNRVRNSDLFKGMLSDYYVNKADQNGFLHVDHFPAFEAHTQFIYSDLNIK